MHTARSSCMHSLQHIMPHHHSLQSIQSPSLILLRLLTVTLWTEQCPIRVYIAVAVGLASTIRSCPLPVYCYTLCCKASCHMLTLCYEALGYPGWHMFSVARWLPGILTHHIVNQYEDEYASWVSSWRCSIYTFAGILSLIQKG